MTKDIEVGGGDYGHKYYHEPPQTPLIDPEELTKWSFYRAIIVEFVATMLFLYIVVLTVIGYKRQIDADHGGDQCGDVGILGIAWAFGGMIFILFYYTAGISAKGHINPTMTFRLFLARKVSLPRAVLYMVAQCLREISGCGLINDFQKYYYVRYEGGANEIQMDTINAHAWVLKLLAVELIYYVLAPLPIGFSIFIVHLATIPITGSGNNPARSFGAAVIYGKDKAWDDQWLFWLGPFIGAAIAAFYHQFILRASFVKALGSFKSDN